MISLAQGRKYKHQNDSRAKELLDSLLVEDVSHSDYRNSMFALGQHLGGKLREKLDAQKSYCVVSTVEDADYLAKGIIESIEKHVRKVYLTCFWNERSVVNDQSIAPIYKQYFESGYDHSDDMIVVKSIMSGSCVVKTNISALFHKVSPETIYVVAPVMHTQSDEKLERQFPRNVSKLFRYEFLAKDDEIENGNVVPGVGGSIYERLGFIDQDYKNTILPDIVRDKLMASS